MWEVTVLVTSGLALDARMFRIASDKPVVSLITLHGDSDNSLNISMYRSFKLRIAFQSKS